MEIQAFTPLPTSRPQDAAQDRGRPFDRPPGQTLDRPAARPLDRPAARPAGGADVRPGDRPDRTDPPRPEAIAKRLRHLAQETRKEVRAVREDLGDLKTKAERLRGLHQEAVETGDRKLHRLVRHLAKHLEVELREARGAAQHVRDQVAFTKHLIERFKDYQDGQGGDPAGSDPDVEPVPAGEIVDLSA